MTVSVHRNYVAVQCNTCSATLTQPSGRTTAERLTATRQLAAKALRQGWHIRNDNHWCPACD